MQAQEREQATAAAAAADVAAASATAAAAEASMRQAQADAEELQAELRASREANYRARKGNSTLQAKEVGILSRSSQEQPTRDRGTRYDMVWERDWGGRDAIGECACCNAEISYGKENMFLSHVHRNDESTKTRSRQT